MCWRRDVRGVANDVQEGRTGGQISLQDPYSLPKLHLVFAVFTVSGVSQPEIRLGHPPVWQADSSDVSSAFQPAPAGGAASGTHSAWAAWRRRSSKVKNSISSSSKPSGAGWAPTRCTASIARRPSDAWRMPNAETPCDVPSSTGTTSKVSQSRRQKEGGSGGGIAVCRQENGEHGSMPVCGTPQPGRAPAAQPSPSRCCSEPSRRSRWRSSSGSSGANLMCHGWRASSLT